MSFRCLVAVLAFALVLIAQSPVCHGATKPSLSEIKEQIKTAGPEQLEEIEDSLTELIDKNPKQSEALVEKASASYPEAKKRFSTLPNGYHFEVMTDIFDADKKHGERVFVQVDRMVDSESGNVVYGRLGSRVQLKNHKFGETLEVKEADILDWTIVSPDGTEEGNLIGKFLDNLPGKAPQ